MLTQGIGLLYVADVARGDDDQIGSIQILRPISAQTFNSPASLREQRSQILVTHKRYLPEALILFLKVCDRFMGRPKRQSQKQFTGILNLQVDGIEVSIMPKRNDSAFLQTVQLARSYDR